MVLGQAQLEDRGTFFWGAASDLSDLVRDLSVVVDLK